MREIRTYGLMRGCWPVRPARRAGVYSTASHDSSHLRVGTAVFKSASKFRNAERTRQNTDFCEAPRPRDGVPHSPIVPLRGFPRVVLARSEQKQELRQGK